MDAVTRRPNGSVAEVDALLARILDRVRVVRIELIHEGKSPAFGSHPLRYGIYHPREDGIIERRLVDYCNRLSAVRERRVLRDDECRTIDSEDGRAGWDTPT